MENPAVLILVLMGLALGPFIFFSGFSDLKMGKNLSGIPTTKIAIGATGDLIEINGKIFCEPEKLIQAPLSGQLCAFYAIEIEKGGWRRSAKAGFDRWTHYDSFISDKGFYVDDNSGAIALVYGEGAKITKQGKVKRMAVSAKNFPSIPPALLDALKKHGNMLKRFRLKASAFERLLLSLFGWDRIYRFVEWNFALGEPIFVLGCPDYGVAPSAEKNQKVNVTLKALNVILSDPKLKTKFDTNKDGVLDQKELEAGAKILSSHLESKYTSAQVEHLLPITTMVFKQNDSFPFVLSDVKEKPRRKTRSNGPLVKVIVGSAVTLGAVGSILPF